MVNLESVFAVLREQCPVSMQSDVQQLGPLLLPDGNG